MESSETLGYRGKRFTLPSLSAPGGVELQPDRELALPELPAGSPVLADLNTVWELERFKVARAPVVLGTLGEEHRAGFSRPGLPRVLDLPIKFPGSGFRLPAELLQLAPVVRWVASAEAQVNAACYDEYYCYLTVDQGEVRPGALQREAPCHVDGFQGARWSPKVRINHTYTLTDALPTAYYVQPFELAELDERRHNFFWEMNRQVSATQSAHAWQPGPWELTLMDAYCVHRGVEASAPTFRTWVRLSFEVRIFDRLGNAHNPMFRYAWPMVPRDIEGLGLEAFDPSSDPSLRVFPWQREDGTSHEGGGRTQPRLRGEGE